MGKTSRLKKFAIGVLVCVVLLLWLLMTTGGNRLLLAGINHFVPGLKVELSDGRLLSGGRLTIDYRSKTFTMNVRDLQLWLDFFGCDGLCVSASGDSVDVAVSAKTSPSKTKPNPPVAEPLSAPMDIVLNKLEVKQLNVDVDGQKLSLAQLSLKADWRRKKVTVTRLDAKAITLSSKQTPGQRPDETPMSSLPAVEDFKVPLPLNIEIKALQVGTLVVDRNGQSQSLRDIALSGVFTPRQLSWQNLHLGYDQWRLDGEGRLQRKNGWLLDSTVALTSPEQRLSVKTRGSLSQLVLQLTLKGQYSAQVDGKVNLQKPNWPFSLDARAERFMLDKLGGEALKAVSVEQVQLSAKGQADDYHADLNAAFREPQVGLVKSKLKLSGGLYHADVQSAEVEVNDVVSRMTGAVNWQEGVKARAEGDLQQLPLSLLLKGRDSRLSGEFQLDFAAADDRWQLRVPNVDLHGQMLGKPLEAKASLSLNEQLAGSVEQLALRYGDSRVAIAGRLGKSLDLKGTVALDHHADDLLPLDAKMAGELQLSGPRSGPTVTLQAGLERLALEQTVLEDGRVEASIDGSANWRSKVTLRAERLTVAEQQMLGIRATLDGDLAEHHLALQSQSGIGGWLAMHGSWQNNHWQGEVERLEANWQTHRLRLQAPVSLVVSSQDFAVPEHCWQVDHSEVCLKARQVADTNGKTGQGLVMLKRLDLADVNAWLRSGVALSGKANGELRLNWQNGRLKKADGHIIGDSIELSADASTKLPIESLALTLASDSGQAKVEWQLNSSLAGALQGDLDWPLVAQKGQGPSGHIDITKMTLEPLAPILSRALKQPLTLAGEAHGKLRVSNILDTPQLQGQLQVAGLTMLSAEFPVALERSEAQLDFHGTAAALSSRLYGRDGGELNLSGNIDWQHSLKGELSIQGKDFRLSPQPGIKLALSPDMQLKYLDNKAVVTGTLTVPYGRVEVEDMPQGVIQPSDDQIIVDENSLRVTRSPVDYSIALDVIVKDDFRVIAMGLDSYITGQIDLTKQPAKALLASGELTLREGRYKAFGQHLQIQKGQIGFNGPLDKPYVNIRAIRNPDLTADEVIAGVELTGSIAHPTLTIFSEPAMEQAAALAYLLNGEPLSEGDSANNSLLTQLLLSQSIAQGKGLVSKVGEKLGFSDVNLSARGSGENTKVEVSGYINSRMQLSYRVGVFDSLSEIAIRYRIFSKLYVEAISGLYDSIDLLYKFDWD